MRNQSKDATARGKTTTDARRSDPGTSGESIVRNLSSRRLNETSFGGNERRLDSREHLAANFSRYLLLYWTFTAAVYYFRACDTAGSRPASRPANRYAACCGPSPRAREKHEKSRKAKEEEEEEAEPRRQSVRPCHFIAAALRFVVRPIGRQNHDPSRALGASPSDGCGAQLDNGTRRALERQHRKQLSPFSLYTLLTLFVPSIFNELFILPIHLFFARF